MRWRFGDGRYRLGGGRRRERVGTAGDEAGGGNGELDEKWIGRKGGIWSGLGGGERGWEWKSGTRDRGAE